MNNFSTAVIFDRKHKADRDTQGLLEIRITIGRKSYYISTGIKVYAREWGGTVIRRPDAEALNDRLGLLMRRVAEEVNDCLANHREVVAAQIRERIWDVREKSSGDEMLEWIDGQIDLLKVTEGTKQHYRTLLMRLREYGRMKSWRDLTVENVELFDGWLHQLKKPQSDAEVRMGESEALLSDAAVYNYHKTLKAMVRRAFRFGIISLNPYDRLNGQFKRGDKESVEYLTDDEVAAIESLHPVDGSQMAVARDLFVFQLHTGLSYADTQAFDIAKYKNVDGRLVTTNRRVKTGVEYVIMLSEECERILEKYGWTLPKMHNTVYNRCLKTLASAAGIDKRVHTHLARHTFGTSMAEYAPLQDVKKMMGHKDIRQTLRYAKAKPDNIYTDFKRVEEIKKNKKTEG
jgi:integrase